MDYFSVLFHGKCGYMHILTILVTRKICFGALKSQFGVKKAKFCELRAKLGHLRSIKAEELT